MDYFPSDDDSNKSKQNSLKSNRSLSVQSFTDKKKNSSKIDRMIMTIDKKKFNWNDNHSKNKKTQKQIKISSKKTNIQKFDEYLSDHMSDDSQSVKEFLSANIKKHKQSIKKPRNISHKPFKKTRLSEWKDNFYTNLMDWNYQNLIFAAAGDNLYHYALRSIQNQCVQYDESDIYIKSGKINSIKCSQYQKQIALAYECGTVRLFDYYKQKTINVSILHNLRITALDWSNGLILTGSKDKQTSICDQRTLRRCIFLKNIHDQQVLGIKRFDNMIATGGNDNLVVIYDIRKTNQVLDCYQHEAAVKSLAWVESQKMLISGGGTSDKIIKFWSYKEKKVQKQVQTGSQICNLIVSKNTSQFVSCQGFSQNQIVVWDYQGNRIDTLHGQHSSRVLYAGLSPSGEYLATGAGDNNLFIWKMFPSNQRKNRLLDISDLR